MPSSIRIKDWKKFQHFKNRRPPWIKLYRNLLDDPDWYALDACDAKVLVMLWLIASEDDACQGMLPRSKKLAFRLRMSEAELSQALSRLSSWLCQGDDNTISTCHQADIPEVRDQSSENREQRSETIGQRAEFRGQKRGKNSRRPKPTTSDQEPTPQPIKSQTQGWGVDVSYPGGRDDAYWDEDSYSGGVEIPSRNSPPVDALGNPYPHPRDLFDLWNEVATCLPMPRTLTHGRAKKASLRLKEQPDLNYWRNVFTRMNRIPFLRGEGERGWKATFDWIVKDPINSENVMASVFGKPKVEYEVVSTTESKPDGRIFEIQDEAGRSFKFLWYRSEPPHEKLIEALLTGARPCHCCGLPYEKGYYFLDNDKRYAGNESDISDWLQEKLRYHYGPMPDGDCPVCFTPLNEDGTCPGILPPGEQEYRGYHSNDAGRDMRSVKWPFTG